MPVEVIAIIRRKDGVNLPVTTGRRISLDASSWNGDGNLDETCTDVQVLAQFVNDLVVEGGGNPTIVPIEPMVSTNLQDWTEEMTLRVNALETIAPVPVVVPSVGLTALLLPSYIVSTSVT